MWPFRTLMPNWLAEFCSRKQKLICLAHGFEKNSTQQFDAQKTFRLKNSNWEPYSANNWCSIPTPRTSGCSQAFFSVIHEEVPGPTEMMKKETKAIDFVRNYRRDIWSCLLMTSVVRIFDWAERSKCHVSWCNTWNKCVAHFSKGIC